MAVIDEKESEIYDNISKIVFSPDSMKVAYSASRDRKWFVVVNGEEKQKYWAISFVGWNGIIFSSDGKKLAYAAADRPGEWFVVVNDQVTRKYAVVETPIFRDDGTLEYFAEKNLGSYRGLFRVRIRPQRIE